jgi:hypothetical protein
MQIRDYSLPDGWFPRDSDSVSAFLAAFSPSRSISNSISASTCRAAISPHAGWYYSGKIAALGVASLQPDAETIVILGGHLNDGAPLLFAAEDAVKTPFGTLKIDAPLRKSLLDELGGEQDKFRDNTIEVLLPMVHYFFPKSQIIWLRLPANLESYENGKVISSVAASLGRKINVLASTDLTHYGVNYGFSPHGSGISALRWVRDVNDKNFIAAVESGNSTAVLHCAEQEHAACSAGAVLGAMGFAEAEKLAPAQLLKYGTSAEADKNRGIPDSFVGYAAFSFDVK